MVVGGQLLQYELDTGRKYACAALTCSVAITATYQLVQTINERGQLILQTNQIWLTMPSKTIQNFTGKPFSASYRQHRTHFGIHVSTPSRKFPSLLCQRQPACSTCLSRQCQAELTQGCRYSELPDCCWKGRLGWRRGPAAPG